MSENLAFVDTETTCHDCGRSDRKLTTWRQTGERVCGTCRSARYRREAGTPERIARTPAKRRADAARWARETHQRRRGRVVEAYGGRCVCCGETERAFLTIDHIDGGGNAHRRTLTSDGSIAGSPKFYAWLERAEYPDAFQVLCHNCNFAKSHGGCPHGNC